jgi:hypothetical protein
VRSATFLALAAGALVAAGAGRGAASPVTLIQHGVSRGGDLFGTFTASSEHLCPSGAWRDALGQRSGNQTRVERAHTCDDGSGTVVLLYSGVTENLAGVGTWSNVSGTGRYAGLRGRGTTSNVVTSYDPVRSEGTFVNTWRGVLDYDATAPSASLGRPTVRRLARGRVRVRMALRLSDAAGNRIAYTAEVYVPGRGVLARRTGSGTAGATLGLDLVVRPGAARRVTVEVVLTDPVGNERTVRRAVAVRR